MKNARLPVGMQALDVERIDGWALIFQLCCRNWHVTIKSIARCRGFTEPISPPLWMSYVVFD
jgi:hypothetical protein